MASYIISAHTIKGETPFQNDFIYVTDSLDASYPEALELAQNWVAGVLPDYLACIPTDVHMQGVTCRSIIANGGSASATPTIVIPATDPGLRTPDTGTGQTSNQNGPLVTYFPALLPGERARVGKVFIPTVNESDAEDDRIGASLATAIDAFRTTLRATISLSLSVADWAARIHKMVVLTPGDPPTKVSYIRAILASATEEFVASQRRRRPFHF